MSRRRSLALSSLLLALVAGLAGPPPVTSQGVSPLPPQARRAVRIEFGDGQVTPDRGTVRAFVPTGSLSTSCLVTLSETNFAVPGLSVFCAPRVHQGRKGLLFSVFPPQPFPTGLILSATVWQENARSYGPPVFFCPDETPNC